MGGISVLSGSKSRYPTSNCLTPVFWFVHITNSLLRRIMLLLRMILRLLSNEAEQPEPDSPTEEPSEPAGKPAKIKRIVDGDTFDVQYKNSGRKETVRLVGVDTPETSRWYQDTSEYNIPSTPQGRDWLIMWGKRASKFTQKVAEREYEIYVETDPKAGKYGPFGRKLAYVHYATDEGSATLNQTLVEEGLARVYTGETFTEEDEYLQIERQAQNADRGLWNFDEIVD